jgi:ferritin-like metal-binding protein YciE
MSNEHIRDWLRDAHAMEQQAESLFVGQAERLKKYPELAGKLNDEVTYIKANQLLLLEKLQKLGGSTSTVKDTMGKLMGSAQNISGIMVSDEPVKGILALHTFTQMAIGSYKVLVAACDAAGEAEVKQTCETMLASVEKRAAWINKELDAVTRAFLTAKAA